MSPTSFRARDFWTSTTIVPLTRPFHACADSHPPRAGSRQPSCQVRVAAAAADESSSGRIVLHLFAMLVFVTAALFAVRLEGQQIIQRPLVPGEVVENPIGATAESPFDIAADQLVSGAVADSAIDVAADVGDTLVPLSSSLTRLLEHGGVPSSVSQLQELELQMRRVAGNSVECTVSVQIGPAQGCGVIITDSGYVLTAAHVATRPGKRARLTFSTGRTVMATTIGMNRGVDAGLLKIDEGQSTEPWPHATLGSSDELVPGMWCIATGHPGGFNQNRRDPVMRAGRILEIRDYAIVTDCALIGGDSGGPLFDIAGRLIAIHSRIGNDFAENLHVPIDQYGSAWPRMQQGEAWGFLPGFRPVIGVRGFSELSNAIVKVVRPDSAADRSGIRAGDVIEQLGETTITDFESLQRAVENTMPGERLRIWINRNGRRIGKNIEIGRADG